jgi:hypothetical protein
MVHRVHDLVSLTLLGTVSLGGVAMAQSGVFRSAPLSQVGSRPTALEVVDLDRDGTLDIVVTNTGGFENTVTPVLGFGDATFAEIRQSAVDVGGLPGEIALGDFDGDDIADVAVVSTNEATLLIIPGLGTRPDFFGVPGAPIAIGGAPVDVASGDLDGDGNLDIVTANEEAEGAEGTVSVLLGNGDLTFTRVDHEATDGQQDLRGELGTSEVVLVDINDDQILDILALNRISESISVFLGEGDGTFDIPTRQAVPGVQFFVLADFNGDGDLDLAGVLTNSDRVGIRLGNGNGTFGNQQTYLVGSAPIRVAARDVNGDGAVDIVTANSRSQDASVLAGDGNGNFAAARTYVADAEPRRLGFGDFDEDGRLDIAVVSEGDLGATVAILRGRADGTFLAAEDLRVDGAPTDLRVADIDGNGYADVVGVTEGGDLFVFPSSGGDGLGTRVTVSASADPLRGLAIADLDADARLDVVASDFDNGDLVLFRGQSNGTLMIAGRLAVGPQPAPVATGDFNGDGRVDLATALVGSGQIAVRRQNSTNREFLPAQLSDTTLTGGRAAPIDIRTLDADCDGLDDLVVANNALNTVSILTSDGDGTFTIASEIAPEVVGELPDSLVVADFDSDGRDDFAVSNARVAGAAASIRLFFGRCDGTYDVANQSTNGFRNIQAGLLVTAIVARDFSGNQITDIGAVNQTANVVKTFLARGEDGVASGVFQSRSSDVVSRMPEALAAGDFDGDGRYDMVAGNTDASSNNITVLLNCARDPGCDIFGDDPVGVAANRGDANDDGIISAADLAALAAEVIDGDGSAVEEVERGSFAGVAGADSNGDGVVDAQDARAIARRIFSGAAG